MRWSNYIILTESLVDLDSSKQRDWLEHVIHVILLSVLFDLTFTLHNIINTHCLIHVNSDTFHIITLFYIGLPQTSSLNQPRSTLGLNADTWGVGEIWPKTLRDEYRSVSLPQKTYWEIWEVIGKNSISVSTKIKTYGNDFLWINCLATAICFKPICFTRWSFPKNGVNTRFFHS